MLPAKLATFLVGSDCFPKQYLDDPYEDRNHHQVILTEDIVLVTGPRQGDTEDTTHQETNDKRSPSEPLPESKQARICVFTL